MKQIIANLSILFICICTLTACNSDTFRIKGEIKDMGTQNVRVIYSSGEDIRNNWIPVIDGKFTIEGSAAELTVVEIFNQQKSFITHVAVKNGDDILIKGDLRNPFQLDITGTDINEEWNKFINKNSAALKKGNNTMTDIAIEKYIRENPDKIVSTLLLMYDYSNLSNAKIVEKLVASIDEPARPVQLLRAYTGLAEELAGINDTKKITSFLLFSKVDSIEGFNPSMGKVSLIYFWLKNDAQRKDVIDKMKSLNKKYTKSKLQIGDITLENDSVIWKKAIKNDSVSWKQFWALGGRMNDAVRSMGVKGAPFIIVTDSVGTPLYRGNSIDDATTSITKKLK